MRTIVFALLLLRQDKWEKDIAALEKKPSVGDIVFIGSSTIRMWDVEKHLPDLKINNRGFGGSQIADSVRYADRIVIPLRPKTVVLFAGGNDINAGKAPEQAFEDYKAFVAKVQGALPDTKIWFMSLYPNLKRQEQLPKTKALNELIAAHVKGNPKLGYIDVASALCPDGVPRAEVLHEDQLHLNERGYAIISKVVREALTK